MWIWSQGVGQGVVHLINIHVVCSWMTSVGHDDVTMLVPDWSLGGHHGPVDDCPWKIEGQLILGMP